MNEQDPPVARPAVQEEPVDRVVGQEDSLTRDETPAAEIPATPIDPFLAELMPEDRNLRRRVVTTLLRSVLADRRIT